MKIQLKTLLILTSIFLFSCAQNQESPPENIEIEAPKATQNFDSEKEALATSVGTQAYLFGASIMTQYYFRNRMKGMILASQKQFKYLKFSESAQDGLHFNELIHTRDLVTHELKTGASPNVDTRYSLIFMNLAEGPQVLQMPSIKDRYFSINVTDAYLGNRPYICSRLNDTDGGKYVFVHENWTGDLPKDLIEIRMPHNEFLINIRILVKDRNTDNDLVTEIQDQFQFESLSKYKGEISEDKLTEVPSMPKAEGLEYFKIMVELMAANPPEGNQDFIWNLLGQVGISKDESFDYESIEEPIKKGLLAGLKNGKSIIQWRAKQRGNQTKTGWFYNLGMGEYDGDYMFRSEWAVQGLTVNSAEEAIYFNIFTDQKGEVFNGKNRYTITIPKDKMPPVNAFWSITSYDENFDFVENENFHYSVGDRSDDLTYNPDGSLTFHVQNTPPESGLSNWIPTPKEGAFKLNFRFYNPKPVMLNPETLEEYLPPVEKVELKN